MLSGIVLIRETSVLHAERLLDLQSAALDSGAPLADPPADALPTSAPPRAVLADALLRARAAQQRAEPGRRALLDQATAELATLGGVRPYWGEMWATAAFVQAQRQGPESAAALAAFERSYLDTPYLEHAAHWRVAFGLAHWSALTPGAQSRLLDEAIWVARSQPDHLDDVFALARQSPAYRAFAVRWLAARRGDADFDASRR